jgi:hypothetical protein
MIRVARSRARIAVIRASVAVSSALVASSRSSAARLLGWKYGPVAERLSQHLAFPDGRGGRLRWIHGHRRWKRRLLWFWDRATARQLWTLQGHSSDVGGIHLEGDEMVTRGFAGDVSRWTLPEPEQVIEPTPPER